MEPQDLRITADDVRELNRGALRTTARIGRSVGTGLMVIGALGAVLWLWIVLRQQQVLGGSDGPFGFGVDDESPSVKQRLDVLASSFSYLAGVSLTAGVGMALRMAAEYLTATFGGSLTAAAVGDALPTAADDLPWADEAEAGNDDAGGWQR